MLNTGMKFNHAPIYDVLHLPAGRHGLRSEDVFFKYINSTNVLLLRSNLDSGKMIFFTNVLLRWSN